MSFPSFSTVFSSCYHFHHNGEEGILLVNPVFLVKLMVNVKIERGMVEEWTIHDFINFQEKWLGFFNS